MSATMATGYMDDMKLADYWEGGSTQACHVDLQPLDLHKLASDGMAIADVSSADISQGINGDCEWCPIALALQRRYGGLWSSGPNYIEAYTIESENEDSPRRLAFVVRYEATRDAAIFMYLFDTVHQMTPDGEKDYYLHVRPRRFIFKDTISTREYL